MIPRTQQPQNGWTKRWRIVIAEDHAILREGLRTMLSMESDFEVVGEVGNGMDAIRSVAKLKPDIVLMDMSMPHTNGTEATRTIKRRYPETKVMILTVHKAEEYIRAAFQSGADGYMLKDDNQSELMIALRNILSGKSYLSPCICDKVVNGYLGGLTEPANVRSWETLTQRQREVLKLVAEGYRNKEIADYLAISHKTVEKHRSDFMKKLDLHSVAAVTAYAIENGIITT